MERRCENCGQPAMPTDRVCWHCGWRLVADDEVDRLEKATAGQGWQQPSNLPALVVYTGLTALVVLLLLVVMGWLGRQPLVQGGAAERPVEGFTQVTAADQSFTLNLPDEWAWLDGANRLQASALEALLDEGDLYRTATFPLGEEVADLDIVFVAAVPAATDTDGFIIVARSEALNLLTAEDAVRFLETGEFANSLVLQVELVDDADRKLVSLIAEAIDEEGIDLLRCQQQLVPGEESSYLVSACAISDRYTQFKSVMASILASFHRLDS